MDRVRPEILNYLIFTLSMNEELVYHQIEINDKPMIAEFLIYDFRFWYEVEASFQYFHVIVVRYLC